MNLTITGQVKVIGETEKFESGLQKQVVMLKTISEYPDIYEIDFINDNRKAIGKTKVGDLVNIRVRMQGREVTSKDDKDKKFRIISLNGFKIEEYS